MIKRYEIDYVWKHKENNLDIIEFEENDKLTGFREVKDGDWVKYSDVEKLQSKIKEMKDEMELMQIELDYHRKGEDIRIALETVKLYEEALILINTASVNNIPFYAYGDNEAACQMANTLSGIMDISADALQKGKE